MKRNLGKIMNNYYSIFKSKRTPNFEKGNIKPRFGYDFSEYGNNEPQMQKFSISYIEDEYGNGHFKPRTTETFALSFEDALKEFESHNLNDNLIVIGIKRVTPYTDETIPEPDFKM